MKVVFVFLFLISALFANNNYSQCKLDKKLLYSILLNEGLSNNKGYEYIISFNNPSDANRVKRSKLKPYFINNRVLDCKNQFMCEIILTKLHEANIKNMDLGAFQINYKYHKLPKKDYFNLESSYGYACDFLQNNIKKYGYNWYAIASYHSATPYYNYKYQRNLIKNYKKITEKLKS